VTVIWECQTRDERSLARVLAPVVRAYRVHRGLAKR
jgi:G:T-mismatch repair DNA endonuclease (very short patch repair protein)